MGDNKLREIRNRLGLTAEEIAEALNISVGYYYKLERGEKRLNVDHLNQIAQFLNVSIDYLLNLDDREEKFPSLASNIIEVDGAGITMLPIIGDIAAGIPITAIPEKGECMPFDVNISRINGHQLDEYFYFRVKGNSMEPTISNHDVVLVHRQPVIENGQVAVVLCDCDGATCKRITLTEKNIILSSDNKDYPPMVFDRNDCIIIGKVVGRYGEVK